MRSTLGSQTNMKETLVKVYCKPGTAFDDWDPLMTVQLLHFLDDMLWFSQLQIENVWQSFVQPNNQNRYLSTDDN